VDQVDWYRIDLEQRHSYELSLVAVDRDEGLTIALLAHDDPM
jgi:Iap family predicted aminopeptidase